MGKELVEKENKTPLTPGIGIAGVVMCPYGFQKTPCLKQGCELWVELNYEGRPVARCALAWQPTMIVELRQEVERIRNLMIPKKKKPK